MVGPRTSNVQYAALPYRRREGGGFEIMLLTSRGTGRWVIPKGWPIDRLTPHEAAAREAIEEGGIVGRISDQPLGTYRYDKQREVDSLDLVVTVFALEVEMQLSEWREQHQRRTQWFGIAQAAQAVSEPELAALIRSLPELIGAAN